MDRYDAIVIGGGLVGCATAYYLSKGGASVALLERGQINQGASGQNAGSLHFQLEHRLIHGEHSPEQLRYYVALTQLAIAHWRGIEEELDTPLELAMHGGLMLAETEQEVALLEKKAELEASQGLSVELIDQQQLQSLAPYLGDAAKAALLCPDEGHCNPRLITPAYQRNATQTAHGY